MSINNFNPDGRQSCVETRTGGTFVNLIAYKSDYVTAQEDLKVIEATARVNKCTIPEN